MARTAFHRRQLAPVVDLDEIKLTVRQATEETVLRLTQRLEATQSALGGRFDNTERALNELTQNTATMIPERITNTVQQAKSEIIQAIPGTIAPADLTEQATLCIRMLSQVQDLVTDKNFELKQNNRTIAKRKTEGPYAEALAVLTDTTLRGRFEGAFREFQSSEEQERAGRLIEIHQLYGDLIRHFASKATQAA